MLTRTKETTPSCCSGNGFRLAGEVPFAGPLNACAPCTEGTTVGLSASATPPIIIGEPAVFNGQPVGAFSLFGGPYYSGSLSFDAGSMTAPAVAPDTEVIRTAPFVFTGVLRAFDNEGLSGTPLFVANLRGSGTAGWPSGMTRRLVSGPRASPSSSRTRPPCRSQPP